MSREGTLHPIRLMSQEIYREPTADLSPEVNDLMLLAHEAVHDWRAVDAERLFDKVLRLRPDNISAVQPGRGMGMQGRADEALEIVRRIHRDQPNYVFTGRTWRTFASPTATWRKPKSCWFRSPNADGCMRASTPRGAARISISR